MRSLPPHDLDVRVRVCRVRGWLLLTCELMGAQACVERN